ncbi:MAG: hypothetical protein F6K62_14240, partial [Sphaerospermopsis sp. SIO1G2]|nr:hypothetical protein [Sphaerospermopsis sp. SIO1G2]
MIRLAPDLKNWATTIEFTPPSYQLLDFIQRETDKIFDGDITDIIHTSIFKELEIAKQDLQQQGETLEPAINAGLEYVFGYRDYLDDSLDSALQHYQQSLHFWQESKNLDRQGKLLVSIGLTYYRQAFLQIIDNQDSWLQARNYFQQSLEIFQQTENQDSLSEYITLLCEIYLKLPAWDDLEKLVNESLKIHQTQAKYRLFLAKDYGFLAELALHKSDFSEAQKFAEKALQTLETIKKDNIIDIPENEEVYYQFLLAKSEPDISRRIEILELAKNNTKIEYNPQLYIDILNQLNLLYFQQEEYLTAFRIKQARLQIEQQYNFRGFIGASYLNPQRKIIKSVNSHPENIGKIAQEIVASGRESDVKKLRSKIAEDRYKLIVIHGESGVGKSSILQAGLIPTLEQETIKAKRVLPILLRTYTNWWEELGKYLQLNNSDVSDILQKLAENSNDNLLTVLIFDQFEEFFFVYPEQTKRQKFYQFLRKCLQIANLKVVISLREDYLHYLLELERKFADEVNTDIIKNTDILSKDIRYSLGNFSPAGAKQVFTSLTQRNKYRLEPDLIDTLVVELAGNIGEIRPIELQLVGTQLENQKITTLAKYQDEIGSKEKLVEGFLENVIQDFGTEENKELANLVLYLLTDENKTRPLKTATELVADLTILDRKTENLADVLKILVASGLVVFIPESPENIYQLVHDYLVEFIRQKYKDDLLANYAKTKAELEKEQEANQILVNAKTQADAEIAKGQNRLKWSSGLAACLLIVAGIASIYSMNQFKKAAIAQQVTKIEQDGVDVLRKFPLEPIPSLMNAVQSGKTLKTIVANNPLDKYPTISPIYSLNHILNDINKNSPRNILKGHQDYVWSVSFSPDGKTIATASLDNTARLWNLNGQLRQEFKGHQYSVRSVSFGPDGKTIATASSDNTARLWNLNGQLLQEFKGHQSEVLSVSFSPDGQTIATASSDKTARLWNLNGQLLQEFKGHQSEVLSVSFSPDGKTIATASRDKTARLWNLNGQLLQEFKGHQSYVYSVSFSPDGKTIATASRDKTARLWNLNGQLLQEFKGHQDFVTSVSFSPDGKTIATASRDKT